MDKLLNHTQYQQGLIDEQNQTKDAAAQAMAVLKLPPEQRGQALQGLFAQAEMNKDQKLMQGLAQLKEMDTVGSAKLGLRIGKWQYNSPYNELLNKIISPDLVGSDTLCSIFLCTSLYLFGRS